MLPVCIRDELKNLGLDFQHDCVRIQAGLSGARVYRAGDYAIKQHALSRLERLARIHQYQHRWADSFPNWIPGLVSWPSSLRSAITTLFVIADDTLPSAQGCWECSRWMPGESIARIQQVGVEQVRAVANALGLLHRNSRHWKCSFEASALDDERMRQRERLLLQLLQTRFTSQQAVLDRLALRPKGIALNDDFNNEFIDSLRLSLATGIRVAIDSQRAFQKLCRTTTLRYPIHGDAWRGNWLLLGYRVSGLIDFSQADIRWPGFDFSRAIGTMALSERAHWNEAWNSYCEVLGDPGYRLDDAILMHRISTVLTLVGYIDRLGQNEPIEPQARIRIEEICESLRD